MSTPEMQANDTSPRRLLVGGESSDGRQLEVRDPATENVIALVADGAVDNGLAACDAAARALGDWSKRRPRERGEILRRAFELMLEEREHSHD